jgi:hypothetical protein
MKTISFIASLFVSILLSGCLSIVNTKGKKMLLESSVPGAKVALDGKEVGVTPLTLEMSRKVPSHEIEVTMPGYAGEKFIVSRQLYSSGVTYTYLAFTPIFGGALPVVTVFAIIDGVSTLGGVGLGIGFLVATSAIVDLSTNSIYSFPKSYAVEFAKLPVAMDPDNCVSFFMDQIDFELDNGQNIGKKVDSKGKDKFLYQFGAFGIEAMSTYNILRFQPDVPGITSQITDAFEDAQFNIIDVQKTHATVPKYRLTAEVDSIGFLSRSLKAGSQNNLTDSKVNVIWKLWTPKSDRTPIGTWQYASKVHKDLETPFRCIEKAILRSAYQLMDDPSFRSALQTNGATLATSAVDSAEVVIASAASYPTKLNEIAKSVVTVQTDFGHGSGFFISADGYVLTNFHVIEDSKEIKVALQQGLSLPARVVKVDPASDLALLRVDGSGFVPLKLAIAKEAELGEDIHVIGTPLDKSLGQTITKGIISGSRTIEEAKYIQIDASVNSGNSGGPLLNANGEVLGIVSAKVAKAGVEGIGFAIPIQVAVTRLNLKL